jgi:hypothetical protein
MKFNWEDFVKRVMNIEGVDINIPQNETIIVRAIPYFSKIFGVLEKYPKRYNVLMYRE